MIRAGQVQPGDRLPTVRDLAQHLGVSPATVSEAWQALGAVGAIHARCRARSRARHERVTSLSNRCCNTIFCV
ncbi:MAG: GntR family transcriptional regulator [Actinobacteria bacterium]|nr:GntR family transcriptional regulator [Actinomycetota bacterium]